MKQTDLPSSLERRVPKSMVRSEVQVSSTQVTTRRTPKLLDVKAHTVQTAFTNEVEGHCPVCGNPMKTSIANGIDVYVCMDHRVTMPLKNENGA
jgi:hypothetical protein